MISVDSLRVGSEPLPFKPLPDYTKVDDLRTQRSPFFPETSQESTPPPPVTTMAPHAAFLIMKPQEYQIHLTQNYLFKNSDFCAPPWNLMFFM